MQLIVQIVFGNFTCAHEAAPVTAFDKVNGSLSSIRPRFIGGRSSSSKSAILAKESALTKYLKSVRHIRVVYQNG